MVEKRPGDKAGVKISIKNLDNAHSFNIQVNAALGEKSTTPITIYPKAADDVNVQATLIPAGAQIDMDVHKLTVPNAVFSTPVDVYIEVVDTDIGTVVASGWFTDQITSLKANISILGITVY